MSDSPALLFWSSPRVRTKICGIGSLADARAAVAAGADAIGLVFAHNSQRRLDLSLASAISQVIGPFVTRVGLFMNDDVSIVEETLAAVSLDVLQFHGEETPDYCARFDKPFIKTVAMGDGDASVARAAVDYVQASALLLDANRRGEPGGRGRSFSWDAPIDAVDKPLIVAGGLDPDNVTQAIRALRPYAVDVSSGVEVTLGVKSAEKMQAFVNAVFEAGKT